MLTNIHIDIIKKLDYHVVFARYKEEMEWVAEGITQGLLQPSKISIMNKGDITSLPQALQQRSIKIPNLGLDQYCHLRYIIDNYDNLPEIVIFTQAGMDMHHDIYVPFFTLQHVKVLNTMHEYNLNLRTLDILLGMVKQTALYNTTLNAKTYIDSNGSIYAYDKLTVITKDEEIITGKTFKEWFVTTVRTDFPTNNILWFKNAIFGVSQRHILSQPKTFYEALISQITSKRGEILHFIERSWYYMLNMDRHLNPYCFMNVMSNNAYIFKTLEKIVVESGQQYIENSLFFSGLHDMSYNESYIHKQVNLFKIARDANTILEIGFNAGHSTALMLLANPKSNILLFDLNEHAYTLQCLKFLKSVFGKDRFIDFIEGDSKQTLTTYLKNNPKMQSRFNLVYIDCGKHDIVVMSAINNCRDFCKLHNHILIVDDYDCHNIHKSVNQFVDKGIIKPIDNILLDTYCGESFHFVGQYVENKRSR